MKVAICLYGLHPDELWISTNGHIGKKKKDRCLEFWKKNVFDINDCDIFIHSFSTLHDKLLEYEPKKYLFEDVKIFDQKIKEEKDKLSEKWKNHRLKVNIPVNFYISYGYNKVTNLMLDYSEQTNTIYDMVLLSRIDCIWLKPLKFNLLDNSKFYSGIWGKNNYHGRKHNGVLSYWVISNKKNIKEYSKVYENIEKYMEKELSAHIIWKTHIDTFCEEITYKFKDISHKDVDMDLQRYLF